MVTKARTRKYPTDESFQSYLGDFWKESDDRALHPGCLVWAFVPNVQFEPWQLTTVGREEPTDHSSATFKLETLRVGVPLKKPALPVAALPHYPGEAYVVYRAKCRPCVVLAVGGSDIDKALVGGKHPKWQTAPTITVAPYYGADTNEGRAGWNPQLVDRIRQGEYPQYIWDKLPLDNGKSDASILRLDHIQPIGRHGNSYEVTGFQLTDAAMGLLGEWLTWLRTGLVAEQGDLNEIRTELMKP